MVEKAVLALCWLDPDLRATVEDLDPEIGRQMVGKTSKTIAIKVTPMHVYHLEC